MTTTRMTRQQRYFRPRKENKVLAFFKNLDYIGILWNIAFCTVFIYFLIKFFTM